MGHKGEHPSNGCPPLPPQTPRLVAAAAAAPGVLGDLLALGADPDAADHRGRTVLHLAATYGLPRVLQVGTPKTTPKQSRN